MYKIALLRQPNSGKFTLFNALTGSHQHVGNWPGKPVRALTNIREKQSPLWIFREAIH